MNLAFVRWAVAGAAMLAAAVVWLSGPPPDVLGAGSSAVSETRQLRQIAKSQLVREVAAGRRSLREAAALSAALDELSPKVAPPPAYPGAPLAVEERLCRRIIDMIEGRPDIADSATVVFRLERELRSALSQPGGLRLPEPDAIQVKVLMAQARHRLPEWRFGAHRP
jgi:hypothetical protein